MDRTTRPLVVIGAFAGSLVIGLLLMLWLLGGLRNMAATGRDRRAISVDRSDRPGRDRKGHAGPSDADVLRLHPLPDVCPTTLFEISEVLRVMGKDADSVNAYYISVDPERDTAAAMKDYLSSFDPHLKGLTGSPEQIAKALSAYRVYAKKVPLKDGDYTMDHTALVYLMDRDGKFVAPFNLNRTPKEAAADLRRYL